MSSPVTSQSPQKPFSNPRSQGPYQKTNNFFNATPFKQHANSVQAGVEFDGKRLRKAVIRKTIDYNSAIVKQLQFRLWQRDYRDYRAIQPDAAYYTDMTSPTYFVHNAINSVTTKFVRTSTNKMRCPIFCVVWTPEGRRLVTGASSGEFTLWNGLTFNFETILQAHDSPVRNMVWSHNDQWMVTGDHAGFVKYWQSNMNNVKMFQAHKEPLRGISFCPTDHKFATCSDDGTVRIWDFLRCYEERILRGHGADVKSVSWHPQKSLLVSGSKDSQQPIKFWDPKSGQSLATLHAHKSTVMEVKWNSNGNWLLTGSRDHLIKLFDIRKLSQEVRTFRGHKKEVTSLAWHPIHESLFASGGSDGAVMFWLAGIEKEVGAMEQAHDSIVWSLAWHPLGHILCSGSNDHTCKFWTRNRPGDKMRDKYNLNILTGPNSEEAAEYDDVITAPSIPGMGLEYVQGLNAKLAEQSDGEIEIPNIPGLDFGSEEPQQNSDNKAQSVKKVPYSKPIPKQFQQQWMENKRTLLVSPNNRLSPNASEMARGGPPLPAPGPPFPPRMMGPDQLGPPRGLMPPGPPIWRAPFPGHLDGPIGGNMPMDMGPGNPRMPENPTRHNFMGPQGGFHGFPSDKDNKNWKEYNSDSDFRRPMDSDFRVPPNANKQDEDNDFFSGNGQDDSREQMESEREDEHDQDLRYSHAHDSSKDDGRGQSSNDLNNVNNRDGDKSFGRGSKNNRAHSRWDPPSTRDGMGSSNSPHFNPPPGNFPPNDQSSRMFPRDWDERLPGGPNSSNEMGPDGPSGPMFSGMRKRPWNDGPGGEPFDPNLPPNNQRNMGGFNRGGGNPPMYNFPQHPHPPPPPYGPNRWISPWGPNRGMRPDMRGMRGRGPPGPGPNMRGGFGWGGGGGY